jgi:hypothetical protein
MSITGHSAALWLPCAPCLIRIAVAEAKRTEAASRHTRWPTWRPFSDLAAAVLDDNPFALLVGMLLDQRKSIRIDIYRGQTFRAVMS